MMQSLRMSETYLHITDRWPFKEIEVDPRCVLQGLYLVCLACVCMCVILARGCDGVNERYKSFYRRSDLSLLGWW